MGEQNVIRLRGVTIYHTDDPFGSRSEKKLLQQGELILSDLNFDINAGEFVYLIGVWEAVKAPYSKLYMPSFNSLKAKDTSQASTCENSNDGTFRCCDAESESSSRIINCSPTGMSL